MFKLIQIIITVIIDYRVMGVKEEIRELWVIIDTPQNVT
jgi:hypothetical protein